MKVTDKYNQIRRDCWADLECENCGAKEIDKNAYDDSYYWSAVIPTRKCKSCNKSTEDMGIIPVKIVTRYPDYEQH